MSRTTFQIVVDEAFTVTDRATAAGGCCRGLVLMSPSGLPSNEVPNIQVVVQRVPSGNLDGDRQLIGLGAQTMAMRNGMMSWEFTFYPRGNGVMGSQSVLFTAEASFSSKALLRAVPAKSTLWFRRG